MHQDARYNYGNFKACFDSLRSVQLVARIDALNLVIHFKSAVTLRPVLIVIGFKTMRISCIKIHATTVVALRRILIVIGFKTIRISCIKMHATTAVVLRHVLIVIGFKTIRISCIKMHATTAGALRRILLRSVQLVARIIGIN